jgi:hypothetical protein
VAEEAKRELKKEGFEEKPNPSAGARDQCST